ncbi:MAG TPA: serine protease, partial [bacterium]
MMDSKPSSPLVHQWVVIIIISMLIFGTAAVAARADTSDTWSLRDTVREIEPAVVWIIAKIDTNEWSQGTGFIIHEDGYIITNAHVVEDASDILVGWPNRFDRDEQLATVIATDPDLDLALLSIPGSHFPVIPFDPLASPMCGDAVVTLGFPAGDDLGLGNLSVTRGIISSIRVESERTNRTIQTDAAVTLGCSGGPLFDLDTGTVVGIVQGKGMFLLEGFNFAVPIDYIFEFSQTPPELGTEAAIASLGGFHDENFSAPWDRSLESYNQGLIARGQASWGEA